MYEVCENQKFQEVKTLKTLVSCGAFNIELRLNLFVHFLKLLTCTTKKVLRKIRLN